MSIENGVEIGCLEVIRELSNYIEDDLEDRMRQGIRRHLEGCDHCRAIYDGERNLVRLVCDERALTLPAGFGQRLRDKLAAFTSATNRQK